MYEGKLQMKELRDKISLRCGFQEDAVHTSAPSQLIAPKVQEIVDCRKIFDTYAYPIDTCEFRFPVKIIKKNVRIAINRTDSVIKNKIYFMKNNEIYFLPIGVHEKFPNLINYSAQSCSILSISKKNFEKLRKLVRVELDENFISSIRSNTFEFLENLAYVTLSRYENIE